jgi:hypothetical protein
MIKKVTRKNKASGTVNASITYVLFFILIITSCKDNLILKNEKSEDAEYFSYRGNDSNIKQLITQLRNLNIRSSFTEHYRLQGKLDWQHAIVSRTFEHLDTNRTYLVPFISANGETKSYIKVTDSSTATQIPELHLYEAQFLKTSDHSVNSIPLIYCLDFHSKV